MIEEIQMGKMDITGKVSCHLHPEEGIITSASFFHHKSNWAQK